MHNVVEIAALPEVIGVRYRDPPPEKGHPSAQPPFQESRSARIPVIFRPFASIESTELSVTEIPRALFCNEKRMDFRKKI
jgi:hypothetical protein